MQFSRFVTFLLWVIPAGLLIGCSEAQRTASAGGEAQEPSVSSFPKDVYPESRNRLPLIKKEELDDAGKKFYDATLRGGQQLTGPRGLELYLGQRFKEYWRVRSRFRNENDLGPRLSILAILVTAREVDQQYVWTNNEINGREAGLEQEIIDVVKYRKPVTGLGEKEAAIIQLGREAIGKHKVSTETYANALRLFGRDNLLDMVALMGSYASTAILLNVFDQHLAPDQKPLLPIP